MQHNFVETILGAIVLALAIAFFGWAYGQSTAGDPGGYTLVARFERVDGLEVGADVKIAGIKVGRVLALAIDPETFRAEVRFSVKAGLALPADSTAAIASASLLGGKYLAIVPGGEDRTLKPGEEITFTQSAVNLEDLIGRYVFGGQGAGGAPGQQGRRGE
ncbi:MAG: outer membrane lipid asymmetry maintenance protein MlaD [Geminicoccaceae bacterium]|nr:outer membrane lipid asymmetry maintenance protein MlaD [Geminicoccaceae bacterium]MCS7266928.1 outer membrane lipid asymmetry maintenance protein MlaD [Geminicoccaceae bacterium]MCX7628807.1 outer membrane lipid asymmetry maintenance protein MlaD [Geminicoccaceae bacterium]MDW8124148.1 outer membrane lipid asymmetry maintenance protein MlaD [Geminicoccaceae bacterium]MDW8342560.1 outer membrane lipid asymmetry maintenance protein MlaD [Geminicoccaceae bacterium]